MTNMPWMVQGDAWGPPIGAIDSRKMMKPPYYPQKGLNNKDIRKNQSDNLGFLDSAMPLIRFMQLAISLPVHRKESGELGFRWFSPIFLYTATVFGVLSYPVIIVQGESFNMLLQSENATFNEQIYAVTPLLLLHTHPLLPFLYWREAAAVAGYFNSWISFENEFLRVCGRPLRLNLRGTVLQFVLVAFAMTLVVTFTMPLYMDIPFWYSLPFFHLIAINNTLVSTWKLSSVALIRAADRLRDSLHGEVASRTYSPDTMADYRQLWLMLSELTQESGCAWTYSCGHTLLYLFLLMTVTFFGVLAGATQHNIDGRTVAFGVLATACAVILFIICSGAESAANRVAYVLREDLLVAQISGNSQHYKNEVQMFMTALAMNPPTVNLSGYTTVNRALFASLLETMVTYLVVLVQFAYSLDAPPAGAAPVSTSIASNSTDTGKDASTTDVHTSRRSIDINR